MSGAPQTDAHEKSTNVRCHNCQHGHAVPRSQPTFTVTVDHILRNGVVIGIHIQASGDITWSRRFWTGVNRPAPPPTEDDDPPPF